VLFIMRLTRFLHSVPALRPPDRTCIIFAVPSLFDSLVYTHGGKLVRPF